MEDRKIFEEPKVECTDCSNYWNDTCDGVPENKERPCNSFIATKRIDLVKRIERLEADNKVHVRTSIFIQLMFILHLLADLIWG